MVEGTSQTLSGGSYEVVVGVGWIIHLQMFYLTQVQLGNSSFNGFVGTGGGVNAIVLVRWWWKWWFWKFNFRCNNQANQQYIIVEQDYTLERWCNWIPTTFSQLGIRDYHLVVEFWWRCWCDRICYWKW